MKIYVRITLLVLVTVVHHTGADTCFGNGFCPKTSQVNKLVPIPHNCMIFCKNQYKPICASAYFNATDRHCYVLAERCTDAELLDKNKGYLYYYRLVDGESCPSGMTKYDSPPNEYSDTYCPTAGMRCPGPEMYGSKPWKNQNRKFCSAKCSRILTCPMYDWKPNEGVDATDPEALGTCYHKVAKCSNEELVEGDNSYNYARLRKGDTECLSSPEHMFCLRKDFMCSITHGMKLTLHKDVPDRTACNVLCLKHQGCGVAAYNIHQYCYLLKRRPCLRIISTRVGLDSSFMKAFEGQDCNELNIYQN